MEANEMITAISELVDIKGAIAQLIGFYHNISMGEQLEELLTPEEALLVLKADIDLDNDELGVGRILKDMTVDTDWEADEE